MNEEIKKKIVSFSQFSKWFTCPHQWYRDYILKEKTFEDNLFMSFGTAIHETVQEYLRLLYKESEEKAKAMDCILFFTKAFDAQLTLKSLKYTPEEYTEFIDDGKNILTEFLDPVNRVRFFPKDKYELLAIEEEFNEPIVNNVLLNAHLDIVLRDKATGVIRIIDFKTSNTGWRSYQKEDFTKTSQLVLYKAIYSKKYQIPLHKIQVEFMILKRKLYDNSKTNYPQTRLEIFKPPSAQATVMQVIQEFTKFVETCFTKLGVHNTGIDYPKIPGDKKKNCKYCQYLKNGKCDGKASNVFL